MRNKSNPGAILINEKFIEKFILDKTLDQLSNYNWAPVWADKRYASDHWMTCPLIEEYNKTLNFQAFDLGAVIEEKMKCSIKNLRFYAMFPGGDIHPHRDMVGNVGLGGLRLHIPIVTNDKVNFVVDGKKVVMGVGELWALDTSYTHSVSNYGSENRVHLVMDIIVNDWILSLLPPKNWRFYIHQWNLVFLGFLKFLKYLFSRDMKLSDFLTVVYNAVKLKVLKK